MSHPCNDDSCARRDGIVCGPDCCDLDEGIYNPREGELTPAEAACLAVMRLRREREGASVETAEG